MEIIQDVLYVASLINTSLQEDQHEDAVELGFNISTGELKYKFKIPEELRKEYNSYLVDYSRTIGPEGEHVYSFANDNKIYVNSLNEEVEKIDFGPYDNFSFSRLSGIIDEYQEYLQTNSFSFITYDPYRKVYYRGVRLALDPETIEAEDRLTGEMDDKVPMIIAYNRDWKVICREKLPRNTYLSNQFFVNENGLYISADHPNSVDLNEDFMQFHLFSLRKVN